MSLREKGAAKTSRPAGVSAQAGRWSPSRKGPRATSLAPCLPRVGRRPGYAPARDTCRRAGGWSLLAVQFCGGECQSSACSVQEKKKSRSDFGGQATEVVGSRGARVRPRHIGTRLPQGRAVYMAIVELSRAGPPRGM